MSHQRFQDAQVAGIGSNKGGPIVTKTTPLIEKALVRTNADVCTCRKKGVHRREVAFGGGVMQRRHPAILLAVHLEARLSSEELGHVHLILLRRPM